jgi:hypothetical protein
VFCFSKICFSWSKYFLLKNYLPLTGIIYIIIFLIKNFFFIFFFLLNFLIYYYAAKNVLINPSNRNELQVDKLTMLFNCPGINTTVGTTVEPNVPRGISKMFVFHFIFFIFLFFIYFVLGFQFFFYFFLFLFICIVFLIFL